MNNNYRPSGAILWKCKYYKKNACKDPVLVNWLKSGLFERTPDMQTGVRLHEVMHDTFKTHCGGYLKLKSLDFDKMLIDADNAIKNAADVNEAEQHRPLIVSIVNEVRSIFEKELLPKIKVCEDAGFDLSGSEIAAESTVTEVYTTSAGVEMIRGIPDLYIYVQAVKGEKKIKFTYIFDYKFVTTSFFKLDWVKPQMRAYQRVLMKSKKADWYEGSPLCKNICILANRATLSAKSVVVNDISDSPIRIASEEVDPSLPCLKCENQFTCQFIESVCTDLMFGGSKHTLKEKKRCMEIKTRQKQIYEEYLLKNESEMTSDFLGKMAEIKSRKVPDAWDKEKLQADGKLEVIATRQEESEFEEIEIEIPCTLT